MGNVVGSTNDIGAYEYPDNTTPEPTVTKYAVIGNILMTINTNVLLTITLRPYSDPVVSPELITGGDFAADLYFDKYNSTTITGGVAVFNTAVAYNAVLRQTSIGVVNLSTYLISFDVTEYTSGNFRVGLGSLTHGAYSDEGNPIQASGHYSIEVTLNDVLAPPDIIFFSWSVGPVCKIDNVSVKLKN